MSIGLNYRVMNSSPKFQQSDWFEDQALATHLLSTPSRGLVSRVQVTLGGLYLIFFTVAASAQEVARGSTILKQGSILGWHEVPIAYLIHPVIFGALLIYMLIHRPVSQRDRRYRLWLWQLRLITGGLLAFWFVSHFTAPPFLNVFLLTVDPHLIPGYFMDLCAFVISLVGIHEMGHYIFGRLSGAEILNFRQLGRHTPGQHLAVLIGGPVFNLLASLILLFWRHFLGPIDDHIWTAPRIVNEFLVFNSVMGIGALLPLPGGGGGLSILRSLFQWLHQRTTKKLMGIILLLFLTGNSSGVINLHENRSESYRYSLTQSAA